MKMRKVILLLGLTLSSFVHQTNAQEIQRPAPPMESAALRPYVIRVQPIVTRDDFGRGPASMALPVDLVEQAYAPAGVGICMFEPIYLDNTKARDGKINLDQIVLLANKTKVIKGSGDILNLIFVNAVDGHKGPLGRGMQGGNITFVALGEEGGRKRDLQGFVIAHEIAHNLSLLHARDDVQVLVKSPNLMGEGEFAERIGPQSLVPSQVERIKKSPFVRPRVDFAGREEGRKYILDETYELFVSQLNRKEVAAFTAEEVSVHSQKKVLAEATKRFGEAVMDFKPEEKEALNFIVNQVNGNLIHMGMGRMADYPWRFVKTQNRLCGGFSYTLGTAIVLSERVVERLTRQCQEALRSSDPKKTQGGQGLILHEQMHVMQRTLPESFARLYEKEWGFIKGRVVSKRVIEKRKVTNPDAPRPEWLIPSGKNDNRFYWARVLFRNDAPVPKMGEDFTEVVYDVEKVKDQFRLRRSAKFHPTPLKELTEYTSRFPVTTGIDHPNEISAYMFADFYRRVIFQEPSRAEWSAGQKAAGERFRQWCEEQFGSVH